MRKSELLTQNVSLFEQLQKANHTIKDLKDELQKSNEVIENLNDLLNYNYNSKDTEIKSENNINEENSTDISEDMKYASGIIGKIVVEAAIKCNDLTRDAIYKTSKDLINLILGKTEVAKSEIYAITKSELNLEEKCKQMDLKLEETISYFSDVMAQQ